MAKTTEEWLRKEEAAARIGISVRTLLVYAADGRVRREVRSAEDTFQKVAMFSAADLDRIAKEREEPAPASKELARVNNPHGLVPPSASLARLAALFGQPAAAAVPEAPWLTPAQAAQRSGLPERAILVLIREGHLAAFDSHIRRDRWRIHREDLDAFRPKL